MPEHDLTGLWPTDGLVLRMPRLELRVLREADFGEAIAAVRSGIHDPSTMPFSLPWTDWPDEQLVPNALRYWWSERGHVSPDDWSLLFCVRREGRFLGVQELSATEFRVTRTVRSGSWLRRDVQRQGYGVEMRAAVLLFAFDHLGARQAETSAFVDNAASNAVSRRLGYREDGRSVQSRRGQYAEQQRYRLPAGDLRRPDWELQVEGLEPCLPLLGADSPS